VKISMKRWAVFLGLLGFLIFALGSLSGQKGLYLEERMMVEKFKRSNAKLEEGKKLFLKEKYDRAEKKLLECLEMFPQNAEARFFLAEVYYKKNDFTTALQSIESAKSNFQAISKFYTFTHTEMLDSLRDQRSNLEDSIRNQEESIRALQGQRQTDEVQAQIQDAQSRISQTQGEIAKIDTQLRSPVPMTMEVPAEYYFIHGNILFKLKTYQGALDQYLETIRRDPKHNSAYNNLANIYFMAREYPKALDCLKQAEANGVTVNQEFKKAIEEKLGGIKKESEKL